MSAKPAAGAEAAAEKPKSKMMLIIIVAVVVLLVAAGGAFMLLKGKGNSEEEGGGAEDSHKSSHSGKASKPSTPSVFMNLDSMVVNLADPGGNRYVQVGITIQVIDEHTEKAIKDVMPLIRNGVIKALSKRTTDELLGVEGKDALAEEILEFVREQTDMPANKRGFSPVEAVLFSSFIVQ